MQNAPQSQPRIDHGEHPREGCETNCPHFGDSELYLLSFSVPPNRKKKSKPPRPKQPLQGTTYQGLARLLKARADALGLSVRDLEALLKKPRTTVHKTIGGQRRLDPIEFLEWCDALKITDPIAAIRSVMDK